MPDPDPLYAPLLASPVAEERMEGIARWARFLGDTALLAPLLADDAPVIRHHAGRPMLVEVRATALVALQDRYRSTRRPWDLGPVLVRAAMSADEAERRCASLPEPRRSAVLAEADELLDRQVRPPEADRAACRAYVALQRAGEVRHERQEVAADTWLTPLQAEVHRSQMQSERPTPHVRFDGPGGPVGYLYRRDRSWVLDLDESPLAREIGGLVREWQRAGRGGVPRVLFDGDVPRRHPSGQGLLLDGTIPTDTEAPLDYLRSVAAFVGQRHPAFVVD